MLTSEEITVGTLGSAPLGLTLLLPRDKYETNVLIVRSDEKRTAVFLEGEHRFAGFEFEANDHWKGALIPNVRIEIEETSIFNSDTNHAPLGALIRSGTTLSLAFRADDGFARRGSLKLPLISDLTEAPAHMSVGFYTWQIVHGTGLDRRVLKTISVAPSA